MKIAPKGSFIFSREEELLIQGKRRELQAMLRFINRAYIALLCRGRTQDAADLLSMYRSLGELDFTRLFSRHDLPQEICPHTDAPVERL